MTGSCSPRKSGGPQTINSITGERLASWGRDSMEAHRVYGMLMHVSNLLGYLPVACTPTQ